MKITVRNDAVMIDGYVNAIERYSKPLPSRSGVFVERIAKGAFTKALERNDDVKLLLDHDYNRELGSMQRGNLELIEDSIGLKAHAEITDPDVIEQARNGDLVGWSFGFSDIDVTNSTENGLPSRTVNDMDLYEVSLINRKMVPAYDGTLVNVRSINGEEKVVNYSERTDDIPSTFGTTLIGKVGWSFGFSDVDVTNGQKPDVTAEEQKAETAEEPPAIEVEETETAEQSEQAESVEIDYSYYENTLELLRG